MAAAATDIVLEAQNHAKQRINLHDKACCTLQCARNINTLQADFVLENTLP